MSQLMGDARKPVIELQFDDSFRALDESIDNVRGEGGTDTLLDDDALDDWIS